MVEGAWILPLIPAQAGIQPGSPPEFTPDVIGGGDEWKNTSDAPCTVLTP
jgi:hypothetical protein